MLCSCNQLCLHIALVFGLYNFFFVFVFLTLLSVSQVEVKMVTYVCITSTMITSTSKFRFEVHFDIHCRLGACRKLFLFLHKLAVLAIIYVVLVFQKSCSVFAGLLVVGRTIIL